MSDFSRTRAVHWPRRVPILASGQTNSSCLTEVRHEARVIHVRLQSDTRCSLAPARPPSWQAVRMRHVDAVPPAEPPAPADRPIRLVVTDDLERSRLTVFFRLFLAIPHFLWFVIWSLAAFTVAFVVWLAVLFERRAPRTLHGFLASYIRYATHLTAYLTLAANPYPSFTGQTGFRNRNAAHDRCT